MIVPDHKGPASTFIAKTVTGPAVYHFGIIDFLQNWTFQKRLERAFKIYFLRKDPDGLSVMDPLQYKIRFQRKLDQIFDLEESAGGIGKADTLVPNFTTETAPAVTTDPLAMEILDSSLEVENPLLQEQM